MEYDIRGTFDLTVTQDDNGTKQAATVFNDVPVTPTSTVNLAVSDTSPDTTLQLDSQGTGVFQARAADAVLPAEAVTDVVPPQTTAQLSGTQGQNGWYRSPVTVALSASDDSSGILWTKYSLDGGQTFISYTAPFTVSQEGSKQIQFYSVDKAGNDEPLQTTEVKIDTAASEIAVTYNVAQTTYAFAASDTQDVHPLITCTATQCVANDQAGNQTRLQLKTETAGKDEKEVEFISIAYNGVATKLAKTTLRVEPKIKKDVLEELQQVFKVKDDEKVRLGYDRRSNQSTINVKEKQGDHTKYSVAGLKILQIRTNKGDLVWSLP